MQEISIPLFGHNGPLFLEILKALTDKQIYLANPPSCGSRYELLKTHGMEPLYKEGRGVDSND
jgi:hypothetical protein